MEPESHIGRRVREVRTLRGLSLTACAGLAAMSKANLSRIESGQQGVSRKPTVEALASALQVAPSDLTGQPFRAVSSEEVSGHTAVDELRGVLRDVEVGALEADAAQTASVDELREAVARATALREACEYTALGVAVPGLLADAFRAVGAGSVAARLSLVESLMLAFRVAKDLGHFDVAWAVSGHLRAAANSLGDPAWGGVADFVRAEAMTGAGSRGRALGHVERAAEEVAPDDGVNGQVHGLLQLSAALQSAVLGDRAGASSHVDAAAETAERTGEGNFAQQHFGPTNVAVWRVGLAVEAGDVEAVPELAAGIAVEELPRGRRASFLVDLGRGLAAKRSEEKAAISAFRAAERLAPQTTRADPYVREAVGDLLRRARRDAGGRDLRGMAYRLGLGA